MRCESDYGETCAIFMLSESENLAALNVSDYNFRAPEKPRTAFSFTLYAPRQGLSLAKIAIWRGIKYIDRALFSSF